MAWMRHNFLLRISDAGTGTCKFLSVTQAPVFTAQVTLRTPKELVLELRRLHDYQLKCASRARACAALRAARAQ